MTTATQPIDQATIFEDLSGSPHHRVDAAAGVIRGVKLIGLESKNRRRYPAAVLRSAAPLYEGAKVNVNHPDGDPLSARGYEDRIGSIRNVRATEQGLYGDFHFNPKHRLADQVLWDAQHNPAAVGFSHNATLRMTGDKRGGKVVEEIVAVRSVDLVADPATTSSIFENANGLTAEASRKAPHHTCKRQPTSEQVKRFRAHLLGYDPDRPAPVNATEFAQRLREDRRDGGRKAATIDTTEFEQLLRGERGERMTAEQFAQRLRN